MWPNNKEYASKDELDEVKSLFRTLERQINEITSGLGFAKWLLAASIGIVPIITTVLEEFKDDLQEPVRTAPPIVIEEKQTPEQRFIQLPDGRFYDTKLQKVLK